MAIAHGRRGLRIAAWRLRRAEDPAPMHEATVALVRQQRRLQRPPRPLRHPEVPSAAARGHRGPAPPCTEPDPHGTDACALCRCCRAPPAFVLMLAGDEAPYVGYTIWNFLFQHLLFCSFNILVVRMSDLIFENVELDVRQC